MIYFQVIYTLKTMVEWRKQRKSSTLQSKKLRQSFMTAAADFLQSKTPISPYVESK
jgi:hypothetical protein